MEQSSDQVHKPITCSLRRAFRPSYRNLIRFTGITTITVTKIQIRGRDSRQVVIEVIYVCIQTFIYSILLYSMIAWSGSKFLWFYFFQIPIWWRWYYWGSPVAWTLYGLITSQVGQNENLVEVPGAASVPVEEFIKAFLGFEYDFLKYVAMAHVAWVVLFFIVFACGIKFLNFQRR